MNKSARYLCAVTLALMLCMGIQSHAAYASDPTFSGGDGSVANPFRITTCQDLQDIDLIAAPQAMFKLMNDIDCSMSGSWNGGAGFLPIGTTGGGQSDILFDGNFKTIRGLTIHRSGDVGMGVGLFNFLTLSLVYNFTLSGGSVSGGAFTGGVAGVTEQSLIAGVRVENMTITASTTDGAPIGAAGGIVGIAATDVTQGIPSILQSSASSTVSSLGDIGNAVAGGLVGVLADASIVDSYSTGIVASTTFAGGLVGFMSGNFLGIIGNSTAITNSYSSGPIFSDGAAAGGIAGLLEADPVSISHSFSISPIFGNVFDAGGIVGALNYSPDTSPVDFGTVFYDLSVGGDGIDCVADGVPNPSCTVVDTQKDWDPTDSTYFLGNSTNGPFPSFDFNNVWQVVPGALPILRPTFGFGSFNSPVIDAIETAPDDSSVTITWTTDMAGNTQVFYGTTDSYGLSTPITDDDIQVTDHGVEISGLTDCTTYHFQIASRNNFNTLATSSDQTFTTTGCQQSVPVQQVTSSSSGGSVGSANLATLLAPSAATTAYLNSLKQNPIPGPYIPGCPVGFICTPIVSATPPVIPPATVTPEFTHDLEVGSVGPDVLALQKYLNAHGFVIATSGPGSLGHETDLFGALTKMAVMKFQKANDITPVTGNVGPKTRAYIETH